MLIYIPSDQLVETDGSSEVIVVAPRRHPEHSNLPRQQFYLSAGGRTGTVVSHLVRFSSISTGFDEEGRRATWADDQPTKRWSVEKMVRVQAEGVDWLVLDDCLRQVSQPCFLSAIPPRGFHRYRVRVRLVIATCRCSRRM